VNCTKHIDVTNNSVLNLSYSSRNWKTEGFDQNVDTQAIRIFNNNCIPEIKNRLHDKNDFLVLFFGYANAAVSEALQNQMVVVEASIGYDSMFAPIRIFETYSQMHKMYGVAQSRIELASNFVNLPGFRASDFLYKKEKDNYGIFLGRVTEQKGAQLAYNLANEKEIDMIFCGPNFLNLTDTKYCKIMGFVDGEKRKELLSNAKFTFCPSLFCEPCNWVAIESQFSGTPVISTDFGGFVETIKHGKTGFRTNNPKEFPQFIERVGSLEASNCLARANKKFSLTSHINRYEEIFKSLTT
jgi:glycosyltransferase involved in cell wall biosynthesis